MIKLVTEGKKDLEITGTGYRVVVTKGATFEFSPPGLLPTRITITLARGHELRTLRRSPRRCARCPVLPVACDCCSYPGKLKKL